MIPQLRVSSHAAVRIPRESGDDPFEKIFGFHFSLYSPRERG